MTTSSADATRAAFLADIIANPADDAVRLIYADWLDDGGEHERAEFIRVQIEIEGLRRSWGVDLWDEKVTATKSEPLSERDQELLGRLEALRPREAELRSDLYGSLMRDAADYHISTGRRVNEWMAVMPPHGGFQVGDVRCRRGFVADIETNCHAWLTHGGRLVERFPTLECVLLTDLPPLTAWHAESEPHYFFASTSSYMPSELLSDANNLSAAGGQFGFRTEAEAKAALSSVLLKAAWAGRQSAAHRQSAVGVWVSA